MTQQRTPSAYREALAWTELTQLMASPLYYGAGVPRGDGRNVLILPGLFGNDVYLLPLHSWLSRIGYRPVGSSLTLNIGCPERLRLRINEELARATRRSSGPVAIIGHSRGGILARGMASDLGERCSHLVLLGSPVGGLQTLAQAQPPQRVAPASRRAANANSRWRRLLDPDCTAPDCGCPFPADFLRPLHGQTKVTSIYSRDDAIVSAVACPVPGARNIEVRGTHVGLVYNSVVYRNIAEVLAPEKR
ncbi:MAG TPA: alpha/beta hydrolase [Dehalococcoidia bacterium]|jgi:pimeloyl-ACP methyl ester carboxylesterase|nr:alpha/beta hydrolase [Dehalococcoidia bacterium]